MNLKAKAYYYPLKFKKPAGTSRGILHEKPSWIIKISDDNGNIGFGEASIIKDLSPDWHPDTYPKKIVEVIERINEYAIAPDELKAYPSLKFALETALADLKNEKGMVYPSPFASGKRSIPINGLIWMGDESSMSKQIEEKIKEGFSCIKLKIGALNFETEFKLLQNIRKKHSKESLTLRVDANGAFNEKDAMKKLERLAKLDIHSIEQPIAVGQHKLMRDICQNTPLPVALDEELIGISDLKEKQDLLNFIKPQYIILKPSLMDGISGTKAWIELAEQQATGWWVTSALESNIGLNAIAQFTDTLNPIIPQGLGTGKLYIKNISSPMYIQNGELHYDTTKKWDYSEFD